jgi:hypothetical protein
VEQNINVYYVPPRELFMCFANVDIDPFATKTVEFALNRAAPVLCNQEIIISGPEWGEIQIFPSKTDICFDKSQDRYIATALVANLTSKPLSQTVVARFEIIDDLMSVPIIEENRHKLYSIMAKFPPVREILPTPKNLNVDLPLISVFNVSLNDTEELDTDKMQHIAGINKVLYTGTAEISSEIIDAGLEIPNLIHKTPEEALNLDLFEPEVQPYLKDLFFDKFRDLVSLHPMDAGDISKTLGFLSLRLIPGEVLPRHKRIFHLSPQDNAYLEELLEQFMRFNYMIRAPNDAKNHHHLYGMSAYLIPRKKPTDLPRLIID